MVAKYYARRKWLNPKWSSNSGAIQWGAAIDYSYVTMDMSVWDCSRKIVLDFGFSTETGRRVVLKKLDIMEEAIKDLRWTATHVELSNDED